MIYKRRKLENVSRKLKDSFKQYAYKEDIFSEESEVFTKMKKAVSELPEPDRTIILCYAELGSLEKVSKIMNVSTSCIYWEIKRIRKELLKKLEK